MATENFAEILNRLKETHEKEVQGLQTKLNELTNEKCRDNQRIEELFTKNHQLREQQKALKENVRVLENRLRAGLCDRCQVTQELAKKKQHEFMKAHFQSLQHIFILTNEMNKLREENKSLKEELKRLCGPEDRPKAFKGQPRDGNFAPDLSLSILSSRSRKLSAGENLSPETEDEYHETLEGDQSPEHRFSPESRISPNILLQGDHALDMSSQKKVNQLQGAIELMRTGSRTSSQERDYPESGSPPLPSKRPPSPQCNQSPSFEAFLRPNKSDCRASPSSCENLRFTTKKEQLYLFNQSLALHHLGLRNNPAGKEGDFPHHLFLAKEAGSRVKPQDEWEDQATILELPGAVLYMKDRHLENRLQLLSSSERLRCLLMQPQHEGKGRREDSSDQSWCQSPSTLPSVGKEGKKERASPKDLMDDTLEQLFQVNRENVDQGEKTTSGQDNSPEMPLDLSDYGRGRESGTNWHQSSVKRERRSPGRDENEESVVPKTTLSSWLGIIQKQHYGSQQLGQFTAGAKEIRAVSPISLPQEAAMSKTTSHDSTAVQEVKIPFRGENQDPEQPDNGDSDSPQDDSDGTVVSESEMVGIHEEKALSRTLVKEEYCYVTENIQNLQRKRKRGHDSSTNACKKSVRGRESEAPTHILPGPQDTKETANHSPAFKQEEHEET